MIDTGTLPDGRAWSVSLGGSDDDQYVVEVIVDGVSVGSWGPLENALFGVISAQFGDLDLVVATWPADAAVGAILRVSNATGPPTTSPLELFEPIPSVAFSVQVVIHDGAVIGELVNADGAVVARS